MSDNKNLTMVDIRLKKQQLKDDLELLEGDFESRVKNVKSTVFGKIDPSDSIKKEPLKAIGLAVAAGLVLGLSRPNKRKKSSKNESDEEKDNSNNVNIPAIAFTTLLFGEVKKIAARRLASYVSDLVDDKIQR